MSPRRRPQACEAFAIATESFTLRATRFNHEMVENTVTTTAERLGLRHWITVGEGRLRQDLSVTVSGEPDAIRELMDSIGAIKKSGWGEPPSPVGF